MHNVFFQNFEFCNSKLEFIEINVFLLRHFYIMVSPLYFFILYALINIKIIFISEIKNMFTIEEWY